MVSGLALPERNFLWYFIESDAENSAPSAYLPLSLGYTAHLNPCCACRVFCLSGERTSSETLTLDRVKLGRANYKIEDPAAPRRSYRIPPGEERTLKRRGGFGSKTGARGRSFSSSNCGRTGR